MATYDYDNEPDTRPDSGERGLACAILQRAVHDLKEQRQRDDATDFMRGGWFAFLADGLGIDPQAIRRRLGMR